MSFIFKHFYFPVEEIHAHMGFKLKVSGSPLPEEFVRAEGWTSQPQPLPSPRSNLYEEAMLGVTGETASPPQPGRTDPLTNSLASHVISSNTKFYTVLITSLDFWHDFLILCVCLSGLVCFFVEWRAAILGIIFWSSKLKNTYHFLTPKHSLCRSLLSDLL